MANVHRIQDYRSNPQQGPQSSSRNFLANLSQQNVGTTEMVKMSMDYRVPFLSGENQVKNPRHQNYFDVLRNAMCPAFRILSFTVAICIVDIAMFVVTAVFGLDKAGKLLQVNSETLIKFKGVYPIDIYKGEAYRVITAIALHGNFLHLFGNLITSMVILSRVEYTYKPIWTILFYLLSGIAGNIFVAVTSSSPYDTVTVGASTSLYGMMGLLVGYFVINWRGLNFLPVMVRLKLILTTLMVVAFAIIFTLGVSNISYLGHLGGFLGGLFLSGVPCSIVNKLRQKILRAFFIILFIAQLAVCFIVFYLALPELKDIANATK